MTSYTKRCASMWRVCWCKFGRNLTKSFWVICILDILSWIPRQSFILDFACLSIYIFDTSPELFVCLSIYENAETLSLRNFFLTLIQGFVVFIHGLPLNSDLRNGVHSVDESVISPRTRDVDLFTSIARVFLDSPSLPPCSYSPFRGRRDSKCWIKW